MIFVLALIATVAVVAFVVWRDRNTSPMRLPEAAAVSVVTYFCFVGVFTVLWAMWGVIAGNL